MTARIHEVARQPWPSRCGYCRSEVTQVDAPAHWTRGLVARCTRRLLR